MIDDDYKDFRAYKLLDSGDKEELEQISIENVAEFFHPEEVLLLVRYDLRRIFIWKGPKAPVRKRFISSRVSAGIQAEAGEKGMHMKVISVDAGDEPIEFLKAFMVEPYEISEDDKVEDMYYIRNADRIKLEEQALKETVGAKKKKESKGEYWSPALDENVKFGDEKIKDAIKASPSARPAPMRRSRPPSQSVPKSGAKRTSIDGISEKEKEKIKEEILKMEIPDGLQKLNIIIGTTLYGPKKIITKVFGKEIEETKWDAINNIPDGTIDIDAAKIKAIIKNGKIVGLVMLQKGIVNYEDYIKHTPDEKTGKENDESKQDQKGGEKKKRELKPIPRGE